jgi:integrase
VAYIFHPATYKPIPRNAVRKTIDGKEYACWTARGGRAIKALVVEGKLGVRCRVESPTWWIEYTDETGHRTSAKGFRDRQATLQLAARLEKKALSVRNGYDIPEPEGPVRLSSYLARFREHLESKRSTKRHIDNVIMHVSETIAACRITTPNSVDARAILRWLQHEKADLGWSQETLNRWVTHLRQFGRWLVREGIIQIYPFAALETATARHQRTRHRRRLDHEHLMLLIETTRQSHEILEYLSGPLRADLYLLAAYTGFRRGALLSLTPASFTWQDDIPVSVSVAPRAAKNKRAHTVPLHPDVGRATAPRLLAAKPGARIWGEGRAPNDPPRTAEMLRHDLAVARAAWVAEAKGGKERARREASDVLLYRDHAGEVFDFHALRVQFISELAIRGVPLTAAQKLADHSTPTLTANVYGRWNKELAGEVAKLPGLGPVGGSAGCVS